MDSIDRFQIMKSYAETIKLVAGTDKGLAEKLSYVIIQYGIYGEIPSGYDDPMLLAFFSQIKIPIDKCRAKSGNAKKDWENVSNQNKIKGKSNENQIERKDKKEKRKIKEINKEKKGYGEFGKCYLTDNQYDKIIKDYGVKSGHHLISEVDKYCARTGRDYKNYEAAVRTFAEKEGIKKLQPKPPGNETGIYESARENDVYLQSLIKGKQT